MALPSGYRDVGQRQAEMIAEDSEAAVRALGQFVEISPHCAPRPMTGGLINQTWLCEDARGRSLVLQRLNSAVFADPDAVMANISLVTAALRTGLQLEGYTEQEVYRRCLHFLPSRSGSLLHRDDSGACWRLSRYIDQSRSYDQLTSLAQVHAMAEAFGRFQRRTATLDVQLLKETIVNFHHTPRRWQALCTAFEQDRCGRAKSAEAELQLFCQHQSRFDLIESALADGRIPRRVSHNDTKVSNLLFERDGENEGHAVLCVMDLDTTMPGSVLYDFGDMVRSVVPNLPEDATDFGQLDWQLDRYATLIAGFAQATRGWLCKEEIERLPLAGGLITLELGMRFLTDYLNGDRYFAIAHPEHNLNRSRAQLRFFEGLRRAEPWAHAEVMRQYV